MADQEPVAHRYKWDDDDGYRDGPWEYGDGYDATGAPNDPDYFAYEPLYKSATDANLLYLAREIEYAFQNQGNLEGRVWVHRLLDYIKTGNLNLEELPE